MVLYVPNAVRWDCVARTATATAIGDHLQLGAGRDLVHHLVPGIDGRPPRVVLLGDLADVQRGELGEVTKPRVVLRRRRDRRSLRSERPATVATGRTVIGVALPQIWNCPLATTSSSIMVRTVLD